MTMRCMPQQHGGRHTVVMQTQLLRVPQRSLLRLQLRQTVLLHRHTAGSHRQPVGQPSRVSLIGTLLALLLPQPL